MAGDKRRTRGSRAANRRRLAIIGLVAFAAVDEGLLALRGNDSVRGLGA